MRSFHRQVSAFALLLLTAACVERLPDPLLGRWYSTEVGSYDFQADGSAVIDDGTATHDGRWARQRDGRVEIELTILGATGSELFEVVVTGDRATFTNAEGEVEVMTRVNHREAMKVTVGRMRDLGVAWFYWLTDERGAGAAGASYALAGLDPIEPEDLAAKLVPTYIDELPVRDGWGRPFELRIASDLTAKRVLSIRSAGSDGAFEGDDYEIGSFPGDEPTHDIVWADGYFIRFPEQIRTD